MNKEELKRKTTKLAIDILTLAESLPRESLIDVMKRQLARSGTSVGANYRAACRARSRADFISKMGIVEEELDESLYWIELLIETGKVSRIRTKSLLDEISSILAITVSSIKTARRNGMRFQKNPKIRNPKSEILKPEVSDGDQ